MSDDFKSNILSPAHWLRILIMAFFAVVTWVLGIILTVLVVAQALFSLITGHDNGNLRQLGGSLSLYFYQVLRFLTYRSEFRPFPFAPFPIDDESEEDPAVHLRRSAPAAQSPVVKPDFATEHEPEAAAGAAMAAAVAGSATGAPPSGSSSSGATAIGAQPAFAAEASPATGQAAGGEAARPAAVAAAGATAPATSPVDLPAAVEPGSPGHDEPRLETPAEPEIIITERIPPAAPAGEGGNGAAQPGEERQDPAADDPHRSW